MLSMQNSSLQVYFHQFGTSHQFHIQTIICYRNKLEFKLISCPLSCMAELPNQVDLVPILVNNDNILVSYRNTFDDY